MVLLFSGKSIVDYNAYFLDENGKKVDEMKADINGDMTLVLELNPKETGYLKSATIKAVTDEGEPNFEFSEILNISGKEEKESLQQTVQLQQTLLQTEQVFNSDLPTVELTDPDVGTAANTTTENVVAENTVANDESATNTTATNTAQEENTTNTVVENTVTENTVAENTVSNETTNTVVEEPIVQAPVSTEPETPAEPEEDVLVDEEVVYQEEVKEKEEENTMVALSSSAKITSPDEILVENVVETTKIYVKLKYKVGETLKVEDLYKKADIEMNGTYINKDLEEVSINASEKITTEWTYTKDVAVSSEITKVSPFEVEGTKGTLVESKIVVERDCTEENYLPLKETVIEIETPSINGKLPVDLDVRATKLKATLGEEINEVTFSSDNWNYDKDKNTITIKVENPDAILTSGEDIYVIVYRYDEYVESEEITINVNGTATVEEYSGKENNVITKDFSGKKTTVVNIGELITYSIGTTDDTLNKAKINANYNSVEAVYETEFTSTVSINILTNDVLREFTLKDTKEYYIDKTNLEFEAQDVKYKTIKFRYDEISEMINQGGTIEVKSEAGELISTLDVVAINTDRKCEILLPENTHGVEVSVKNIKVNGTITIDFSKSIGKCAYEKQVFNAFDKIESRVKAEVKYGSSDEVIELTPLKTEKYFEKSYTRAEISMNKEQLSTIMDNENVELKIELFNSTENSDLYINPEFEIVFPSFIQDVEVKSVNLLYEEGLVVKNISLFKDDKNIQRMKVQLEGVQREFSSSELTNGTNIIINTKIMVDDYTPQREDQLKMYYFNQGVTNYQSQTDWKISSPIPDGILKTTNGFDVEVFSFQAPSGFVTVNGIENYDGMGSVIESIKQGEITAKAEMGEVSRIVTMNLAALNNTGNKCSNVAMIGRIPNTEATDIITGEKLGTNRNTQIVSEIVQADINPMGCDIYYSYNPKADRALSNGANGWIKHPEDMSQVKSFMIIPTKDVEPGTLFKFSYNFQVPANLPYEVELYGAFGAFYNNHSDIAIAYESTKADLVGLVTEAGPKIDVNLSVDIGDGAKVLEEKRLKYTISVVNSGSITATNVNIKAPVPRYTGYVEQSGTSAEGDYGFNSLPTTTELEFNIADLEPGETREFSYSVKTGRKPSSGMALYITNKVVLTTDILAKSIESNEVKNELDYANFSTSIRLDYDRKLKPGYESNFILILTNISGKDLKNVVAVFNVGQVYEFSSGKIDGEDGDITFDANEGKIYFKIGNMKKGENINLSAQAFVKKIYKAEESADCYFEIKADEMDKPEISTKIRQTIQRAILDAKDITVNAPTSIKENERVVISTEIVNSGKDSALEGSFFSEIPDCLKIEKVECTKKGLLYIGGAGIIEDTLPTLEIGESITVDMILLSKNLPGKDPTNVTIERTVRNADQDDIHLEPIKFTILNTEKTVEEIEEEKRQEFEDYKQKYEEEEKKKQEQTTKPSTTTPNTPTQTKPEETKPSTPAPTTPTPTTPSEPSTTMPSTPEQTLPQPTYTTPKPQEPTTTPEPTTPSTPAPTTPSTPAPSTPAPTTPSTPTPTTPEPTKQETPKFTISGVAWVDENKNGSREDEEKTLSSVKVYLLTVGYKMLKSTTTNGNGVYQFGNVESGKYIVAFAYDTGLYTTAVYKKSDVGEDRNSDVIASDSKDFNAISNTITIDNANIEHIDIGLQNKDTFDLQINKYLTKIKVTTSKGEKTYNYKNVDLAKVDIHSKQIKGAKVDFEYVIKLENKGSLAGYAEQIVDYLPEGMEFDENSNENWYKGNDGYVYIKNINQVTLNPGQTKEFKLNVSKTMDGENTGTVANKVEILKALSNSTEVENTENNSSVQNTIVTVSTGKVAQNIFIIIFVIAILAGLGYTKKLPINISFNKVYKSKDKKISLKKFYK